jgi:RHS repeat-associated protein
VRAALRVFLLCLLCLGGLASWSAAASRAAPPASVASFEFLNGPLVLGGVEPLDEGRQLRAAEDAERASPDAVAARARSRTAFAHLSAPAARALAAGAFPGLVDRPAGGAAELPAGARLVRYTSAHAAQVELPGGRHGAIDSLEPIASEGAHGYASAADLHLVAAGEAFEAKAPLTRVRIGKRASDGVALARSGVSLTPLDGRGKAPVGAEGTLSGASVIYPNTQAAADTLAKPTSGGFELATLLRSPQSPQELYFRLGLPAGARLAPAPDRSGSLRVLERGAVIAAVSAPAARDAQGAPVPASMRAAGDVLRVTVDHRSGDYGYPIVLDPTVEENAGGSGKIYLGTTWGFYTASPGSFRAQASSEGVEDRFGSSASEGAFGFFYYNTQGESQIYSFTATTASEDTAPHRIEDVLRIFNPHSKASEAEQAWVGPYLKSTNTLSSAAGPVSPANNKTQAVFRQSAREGWSTVAPGPSHLYNAKVGIVQEAGPSAWYDNQDKTLGGKQIVVPAIPGDATPWVNPSRGALALEAFDPGVGISRIYWNSPSAPSYHGELKVPGPEGTVQRPECLAKECSSWSWAGKSGTCEEEAPRCKGVPTLIPLEGLPEGENTVGASVEDGVGLKMGPASGKVGIDGTPPYNVELTNHELVQSHNDCLGPKASDDLSGVARIEVFLDGKGIAPCINGEEYAAGKHWVKIVATDRAGNSSTLETTVTLLGGESKPIGPGSVSLVSGAFMMSATDVSLSAPPAGLSVERGYDSQLVARGSEGPLGPQWQGLSFGGDQKLTKLPSGSVVLSASSGRSVLFFKEGSSFSSPPGDAGLTLKEQGGGGFALSDQRGDVTKFSVPEGGTGTVLSPSSREEPGHAGATKYSFRTVGGVTEPTQALAPASVSCEPLARGCRALSFGYAPATTAKGEGPEEWGDYTGRLASISFTAWDPAKGEHGEMSTVPVAQYAYDKKGRLRAEWDPRIKPALKTTYGYDEQGYLTSVAPPGQEPWLLHYGTLEDGTTENWLKGDVTPGRLLSVTRPSASQKPGNGLAPVGTEAPKVSPQNPAQGTQLSVSGGGWENEPLAYSYQWERCHYGCEMIASATNPTYTVRYGQDEESSFRVRVTATNAGGSSTVTTAGTATVPLTWIAPSTPGSIGSEGTGRLQFKSPSYIAVPHSPSEGGVYVSDTGNKRILEFGSHTYLQLGEPGSGGVQLSEPTGIAARDYQSLWSAESATNRVSLYFAREQWGLELLADRKPSSAGALGGLALDESQGLLDAVLVAQAGEHSQIDCFAGHYGEGCSNSAGPISSFAGTGTGPGQLKDPAAVAYNPVNHYIYVADTGNNRVEYFDGSQGHVGEYKGQFGAAGTALGQFSEPRGIAVDKWGQVWVADTANNRVEEFSADGKNPRQYGESSGRARRVVREAEEAEKTRQICGAPREGESSKQKRAREKCETRRQRLKEKRERREHIREKEKETEILPGQLYRPIGIALDQGGDVYVVDSGDGRVVTWWAQRPKEPGLPPGTPPAAGAGATWTIDYRVPLAGEGLPSMNTSDLAKVGQTDVPVEGGGTAIFPPDEPMGWPAKDYRRATIYYTDAKARTVNTSSPTTSATGAIATSEYNPQTGAVERTLSADNREIALGWPGESANVAARLATKSEYNSEGTQIKSTTAPQHMVALASGGAPVAARKLTKYTYDEGAPSEGGPYGLVTKQTESALVGSEEKDTRTTKTSYAGEGWKLRKPTSVTADPGGLGLEHTSAYAETGNLIETRQPANVREKSPHATEAVYYTAGPNPTEVCGGHPEWANLLCQTRPAKQPETASLPNLPVTTVKKYNVWDEPEATEEVVGSTTRTKSAKYDTAGRLETSTTAATAGTALPTVSYAYNRETGALESQSTTSEGTTRKITSVFNALGQLEKYTDADGNPSEYTYDVDGRPIRVNDGKGSQTYTYDPTSGFLTKLEDSAITSGAFTAEYSPEGRLLSETYPNNMTAKYTYDAVGQATALEYVKNAHCATNCPETWFKDTVARSITGQWMSQESTLSKQSYSYDGAGRLTQVQSTPAGKGCTTRIYAYDRDGNRLKSATRPPEGTACATKENGTVEAHTYDQADRLIDAGVAYNEFGDVTALPPRDAGGSELTGTYFADNQQEGIVQHENEAKTGVEEGVGYRLDPAGRNREIIATGKVKTSDTISHFAGAGNAPAWTAAGAEWTRNIAGVDGQLAAVQTSNSAPEIQLPNLHGDIVATAYLSEGATALASTADTTEFGVPSTNLPPKYAWLGAIQLPTELPSGVVAMGARTYVPQLGRFLQPDPVPGGSANAYSYTFGDPLTTSDPSGAMTEYTIGGPGAALVEYEAQKSAEAAAEQAAENVRARQEAEFLARLAAASQQFAYGPGEEGGEEEWEEGEEEGEEEGGYVGYHHGAKQGHEEARLETGVLYQPLEQPTNGEGASENSPTMPFCQRNSKGPCASLTHAADCWYRAYHKLRCVKTPSYKGFMTPQPGQTICHGIEALTKGGGCGVPAPGRPDLGPPSGGWGPYVQGGARIRG